jgi:hypothetical protein
MIRSWLKSFEISENDDANLESLEDVKQRLNYFRTISKNGIDTLSMEAYKQLVDDIYYYFLGWGYWVSNLEPNTQIYRATVNKRITHKNEHYLAKVSQLTGPPLKYLKNIGRCNALDIPVFYSSTSLKAAIFEAVPSVGDYVTVSRWELKANTDLPFAYVFHPEVMAPIPEYTSLFESYNKSGVTRSKKLSAITSENIKFLTEEFIKQVEGRNPINYLFSSIFSETLFTTHSSKDIEALMYPSVKIQNGHMNLAFPDSIVHEKFDLAEIGFTQVLDIYDTPDVSFRKIEMKMAEFQLTTNFNVEQDWIGLYAFKTN